MKNSGIVQELFSGELDIIGDVHGEIDALDQLLDRLGYAGGSAPDGRRLVFVGDLVDRGPDSLAVVRRVRDLVEAGLAQMVVGNHELNALRDDPEKKREGEDWWYGRETAEMRAIAPGAERDELKRFLASCPLALERSDLRVVHACWDDDAIRRAAEHEDVLDAYRAFDEAGAGHQAALDRAAEQELQAHGWSEDDLHRERLEGEHDDGTPRVLRELPKLAERDEHKQCGNPVSVVISGVEKAGCIPFYASGKWRVVERDRWWSTYRGPRVIVGHYWRSRRAGSGKPGLDTFDGVAPFAWLGSERSVMCVDYSVGKRAKERAKKREKGAPHSGPFDGGLAALRTGSWELWFDDRDEPVPLDRAARR